MTFNFDATARFADAAATGTNAPATITVTDYDHEEGRVLDENGGSWELTDGAFASRRPKVGDVLGTYIEPSAAYAVRPRR